MLFGSTRYIKFLSNTIDQQLVHIQSEIDEVREAVELARETGDWDNVADELVDIQMASDTALHIVMEQHGADSFGAFRRVTEKNARRGYYEG